VYAFLPVYWPATWPVPTPPLVYGLWGIAAGLGICGLILFLKGLLDLGTSLTPLPHPREDGHLVQSGIYGVVRHPVYSGVVFVAIAWAIYQVSLSHLIAALLLGIFFDAKASQEERWLVQIYPGYEEYRQRVKKLLPWIY
jgi:protein-S-isoprenylcysteine O-methyltransferase Ste14